ncbi:MAG TPA: hypothetical protein VGB23_02710, partial [Nitrospirota bacterium]
SDERWDAFMNNTLVPLLDESAVVRVYPDETGAVRDADSLLADRVVRAFTGKEIYEPVAVVFLPYFERELVYFGESFELLPQTGAPLRKNTSKLVELVERHKDDMRMYI